MPVEITLADGDEPDAEYQVRVLVDGDGALGEEARVVAENPRAKRGTLRFEVDLPAVGTYVLAQIVQRHDEDSAWTAPVWIDREGN